MRILRIISSVNPASGGPIEGIRQSSQVLAEMGHSIELASLDAPDASWVADSPFPVHALGPARGSYRYAPAFPGWLREKAGEYDRILVHGLWQHTSFGAWLALHRSDTPYFVFPHGMLDPWFKRAYPLKHIKKSLYWLGAEYRVLRDASAVLFTCEEERRLARQSFRPYRCQERVVNYGTAAPTGDPDRLREVFLTHFPTVRDKRLLLFLGRLHEKKGCDLLIEAFAAQARKHPELHLIMAGPDQTGWQNELEKRAAKHDIASRITWTGMLSGERKWGAFYAADAFVLPSHQENFGIAVVEAMACGCPVLISDKINIWREIQEDNAGLVASDDLPGTTSLLEKWLAMSAAQQDAMRRQASVSFQRRFEIRQAAQSLLGALSSPVAGGKA